MVGARPAYPPFLMANPPPLHMCPLLAISTYQVGPAQPQPLRCTCTNVFNLRFQSLGESVCPARTSGPVDRWTHGPRPHLAVPFGLVQLRPRWFRMKQKTINSPSTNKRAVCLTPPPVLHGSAADWLHCTLVPVVQSEAFWTHEVCVISKVPSWLPAG